MIYVKYVLIHKLWKDYFLQSYIYILSVIHAVIHLSSHEKISLSIHVYSPFLWFTLIKAGNSQIMRQGETLKQIQLVLIRYELSTCNNGAAITHNAFCLSFAWQRQSLRSGTV